MRSQHNTDGRAICDKCAYKQTGCLASLRITVKRNGTDSRSLNAPQNNIYPTTVVIDNCHYSAINAATALKFRDMGPDSKQTLLDLFRHGHTASSTLHSLKRELMLTHGNDYFHVAADGHFIPPVNQVQRLYYCEFKQEYGAMSGEDMFADLDRLLKDYCDKGNGGIARFGRINDPYFVAICSSIMARAH